MGYPSSSYSSMTTRLAILVLLVLVVCTTPPPRPLVGIITGHHHYYYYRSSLAEGAEVCVCQCCRESECNPVRNGTISVTSCGKCTSRLCKQNFGALECETRDMKAICIKRDSWFAQFSVFTFLIVATALLICGCFKEYAPIPAVRRFNERHFK
eukprot:gb/GECH01005171.1/.p1 GENE.gb/GECH01005171.1/~~gb/GECH01005171.1/.p1  ORF type:complete len:154 (+),score=15.31 gb/GECH01005171.1/:1-462(+)